MSSTSFLELDMGCVGGRKKLHKRRQLGLLREHHWEHILTWIFFETLQLKRSMLQTLDKTHPNYSWE